jgi:superfamily I DNA/RNA helicase
VPTNPHSYTNNRTDFAHLQSIVYGLLLDPLTRAWLASEIRYVLVDEYQDTNYVQEQFLQAHEQTGNLCVVGTRTKAFTVSEARPSGTSGVPEPVPEVPSR